MKRLSIYFLAFLTLWMSTWMVTDIHDIADNAHVVHQVLANQHTQSDFGYQISSTEHEHNSHCGVCSYDHGGHIGQTLATSSFVAENIPVQNSLNHRLQPDLWLSRNIPPKIRPPIV
jgi:hypothetical protein